MTGFVEDLSFDKALDIFRESLSKFELDEEFFKLMLLKTAGGSHNLFFDLVVERYVNEIELLQSQIQSYHFRDPEAFFQNLPSPSHEEIVLPSDLQIEDNYVYVFKAKTEDLVAGLITKEANLSSDQEGPEEAIPHDVFIDPISDYMELLLNSSSLACFLREDQIHQQRPFYTTILIIGAHDRIVLPSSLTISEPVHLFLQLLKWLHWLFDFT
jgi:hypothetical protein